MQASVTWRQRTNIHLFTIFFQDDILGENATLPEGKNWFTFFYYFCICQFVSMSTCSQKCRLMCQMCCMYCLQGLAALPSRKAIAKWRLAQGCIGIYDRGLGLHCNNFSEMNLIQIRVARLVSYRIETHPPKMDLLTI